MSFQVNGLNTIPNYSKPQVNTSFKANPVATTNTLKVTKVNGTEQINYYDNFLEVDARNAESKIAKLLGGFIPV